MAASDWLKTQSYDRIPNNNVLKMNNHLPLQSTPRISVSWVAYRTMTCICFGCSALPPRYENLFIAVSLQVKTSQHVLVIIE